MRSRILTLNIAIMIMATALLFAGIPSSYAVNKASPNWQVGSGVSYTKSAKFKKNIRNSYKYTGGSKSSTKGIRIPQAF